VAALPTQVRAQGLAAGAPKAAAGVVAPGHNEARPLTRAMERAGPIAIDGRLDEATWALTPAVTDFSQQDPHEGQPATQRTEVRFLFDDDALYIGARMYDSAGARGVHARLVRRDQQSDGDYIAVIMDTYHDHAGRTAFQLNPAGAKSDAGQAAPYLDPAWDPVWQGVTAVDSLGWTAEMRIPWSQLRFPRDSIQTWGLQIWRYEERLNETSMWAYWPKADQGGPQRFGHLEGLHFGRRARGIELLPYAVARASYVRPLSPGSPFESARDYGYRAGGDVKALVGSNLTLDATINPDFGQVEADPASINLSAFETYYSEQRPFFVAGSGLFSFGGMSCYFCSNASGMSLFYSRRIGRPPHLGAPADARDAARLDNTTILGAAKITGRTASGLQVGLLDAATAAESIDYIDASGLPARQRVEPFTNYFVGRLLENARGGKLRLGVMGTSVVRDLSDPVFAGQLPTHAEALGVDWDLIWKSQMYRLTGNVAVSHVSGDDSTIAGLQRSSARYFDRPDRGAHHNDIFTNAYDPSLTSLRGIGGYARLAKQQGVLRWEGQVNFRSPGFEVNDLAFLSTADYVWLSGNVYAYWSKPTHWYRTLELIGGSQQQSNFDGDLTGRQFHAFAGVQPPNYWFLSAYVIDRPDVFDDRATRGGPVIRGSGSRTYFLDIDTDSRKSVQLQLFPSWSQRSDGLQNWSVSAYLRLRAASNLNVSFGPNFGSSGTRTQYVGAFSDPAATTFYGRRVVFAEIRQKSLSLDTRISATFTPDLTLELYAQPFVATGLYRNFKEYTTTRSRSYVVFDSVQLRAMRDPATARVTRYCLESAPDCSDAKYVFDNPDFNYRSLRGNAVLRWEWRPGSTLYLVWQQNRAGTEPYGDFAFDRDAGAIFRQHSDNVFLVKMSYWFGR
jgi:hypothetical protein